MTISYKKNSSLSFDILINGRKRGQIVRKLQEPFRVQLTGLHDLTVLSIVSRDAAEMNCAWIAGGSVEMPTDFRVGLDTTRTRYAI